MPSIDLPNQACFPDEDRRPSLEDPGQPVRQWDESRCHACVPNCTSAACDYGSGRCMCPLGLVGPACTTPAPRLLVVEGQTTS
eukprot:1702280-Heterocapsa_arctica.AAC.1